MTAQPIPLSIKGNKYHPLRILREQKLMRQLDLAQKAGVAVRTILAVERSQYQPRMETRRKILTALGMEIGDHFEIFGPLPVWSKK